MHVRGGISEARGHEKGWSWALLYPYPQSSMYPPLADARYLAIPLHKAAFLPRDAVTHESLLPTALRACLSSRVKAVSGTSSDTGIIATVERLLAGFPASHLLPELWYPRGWPVRKEKTCHQPTQELCVTSVPRHGFQLPGSKESARELLNPREMWHPPGHIKRVPIDLLLEKMKINFCHFWLLPWKLGNGKIVF